MVVQPGPGAAPVEKWPDHDVEADVHEAGPVENDGVVLLVLVELVEEAGGHLAPVASWVDMVCNVIPIVERALVVRMVDDVDGKADIVAHRRAVLEAGGNEK